MISLEVKLGEIVVEPGKPNRSWLRAASVKEIATPSATAGSAQGTPALSSATIQGLPAQ